MVDCRKFFRNTKSVHLDCRKFFRNIKSVHLDQNKFSATPNRFIWTKINFPQHQISSLGLSEIFPRPQMG